MRPVTVLSLPCLFLLSPRFHCCRCTTAVFCCRTSSRFPCHRCCCCTVCQLFSQNEQSSYQQASRQAGRQKNSRSTGDTTTKPGNKASRQTDRLAASVSYALTSSADLPYRPLSKLTACTTTNTIKIWFSKVGNQC